MKTILIVDDERIIVEGIAEMLRERLNDNDGAETIKAFSAVEALRWLDRTRIDVVVTDIRMPEMTGIELQAAIADRWPRCKVIFLTGYHDFHYVQSSVRGGAVDYVLKTEGDAAIFAAVSKAFRLLDDELASGEAMRRAKQAAAQALPAMRNEYFAAMIDGETSGPASRDARFRELDMPLRPDEPVYLLLGRVDRWPEAASPSDKALYGYAMDNMLRELLADKAASERVAYAHHRLVWLLQPAAADGEDPASDKRRAWIRYVRGTVEQLQAACRSYLKLTCSFVAADAMCDWERLAASYRTMSAQFVYGAEMFLTGNADRRETEWPVAERIALLAKYADDADRDAFFALLRELTAFGGERAGSGAALEAYYALVALLLGCMNRWKLAAPLHGGIAFDKLGSREAHGSWEEAARFLQTAFECLFDNRSSESERQTHDVVRRLHDYIDANLDGDLSLARLAELVYFAPTYLSRFYKLTTGTGLYEYIVGVKLARAKELLRQPQYKIHEIGLMVGFASPPYFTRFIKKSLGISPQEYRDRLG
ncbi:MAG: response regulator [Paenibacillaceae bacterium]|nr:response regulator [Paenibacillaceae bacterium]